MFTVYLMFSDAKNLKRGKTDIFKIAKRCVQYI